MSGPVRERRYPLAPALRFIGTTQGQLAETIGMHRMTVNRYRIEGIPETAADRMAVALGVHPSEIWGELWWKDVPDGA